jgi:RND family efflux transporter MFP subunit
VRRGLRWGGITGGVAAASVALALWAGRSSSDHPTAAVQREDVRITVEASGQLRAAVSFEIGPPSVQDFWEYNLSWMIPEGTFVEKGAVIARFDATEIEDRLREHKTTLEKTLQEREKEQRNLEVDLKRLRLDLVKAEGELKQVDLDLSVPQDLVSFIELEQTRLKRELAARRVEFLREKIDFSAALVQSKLELLDVKSKFAEGKIAYNEDAQGKFEVRAPVAGLVVYQPKGNGDRWEIGEGVWMLAKIMEIADISTLQIEADVLEVDAARVAPGQPAEITVDAIPGLTMRSTVERIGRLVHQRSMQDASKVFEAILPLQDPDTSILRPGMGVQLQIETALLTDRLTIPLEAVRLAPDGPCVDVHRRDGAVERRAVVLGQRTQERVVVESGLEEGERVAVGDAAYHG